MDIKWLSFILFLVAALIHIGFFVFEAFLLQKSNGAKLLKIDNNAHKHVKVWALNQGFYNLFLAVGTFIGLTFVLQQKIMLAGVLIGFCGACMVLAGIVLAMTAPHLRKFALLQALPPLIGFVFLYFHIISYY